MNDELPEDVSRWPVSPWQLLGVRPGDESRDIRNAYVRLIKKYRPEVFPEQYRRIREAYESLRGRTVTSQANPPIAPIVKTHQEQSTHHSGVKTHQPLADGDLQDRPEVDCRKDSGGVPPQEDGEPFEEIWEQASRGEKGPAYLKLRKIASPRQRDHNVFAALYWLLRIDPTLDSDRIPFDWIQQGLDVVGFQGVLAELFMREIAHGADPNLRSRWTKRVLSDHRGSIRLLQSWCEARSRKAEWGPLLAGLESNREQVVSRNPEQWFRYMLFVLDCVAWEEDAIAKQLCRACWDEIQGMSEWHLDYSDAIFWYDEYATLVAMMKRVSDKDGRFVNLACAALRAGWKLRSLGDSEKTLSPPLESFVSEVVQRPFHALKRLDEILRIEARNPPSAGANVQAGKALVRYLSHLFDGGKQVNGIANGDHQRKFILEFFDEIGVQAYEHLREPILKFCIREVVRPSEIVDTLRAKPNYDFFSNGMLISESLNDDSSFRLVLAIHERMGLRMLVGSSDAMGVVR